MHVQLNVFFSSCQEFNIHTCAVYEIFISLCTQKKAMTVRGKEINIKCKA